MRSAPGQRQRSASGTRDYRSQAKPAGIRAPTHRGYRHREPWWPGRLGRWATSLHAKSAKSADVDQDARAKGRKEREEGEGGGGGSANGDGERTKGRRGKGRSGSLERAQKPATRAARRERSYKGRPALARGRKQPRPRARAHGTLARKTRERGDGGRTGVWVGMWRVGGAGGRWVSAADEMPRWGNASADADGELGGPAGVRRPPRWGPRCPRRAKSPPARARVKGG